MASGEDMRTGSWEAASSGDAIAMLLGKAGWIPQVGEECLLPLLKKTQQNLGGELSVPRFLRIYLYISHSDFQDLIPSQSMLLGHLVKLGINVYRSSVKYWIGLQVWFSQIPMSWIQDTGVLFRADKYIFQVIHIVWMDLKFWISEFTLFFPCFVQSSDEWIDSLIGCDSLTKCYKVLMETYYCRTSPHAIACSVQ